MQDTGAKPSVEDVKSALGNFMRGPGFPKTVLFRGPWGVGKTCLWNDLSTSQATNGQRFVYVSLFGTTTIDEISISIALELLDENLEPEDHGLPRYLISKGYRQLRKLMEKMGISGHDGLSALGANSTVVSRLFLAAIDNAYVCLDDAERKSDKLLIREILGLIDKLRERNNCNIILILNDVGLDEDERKDLQTKKERVF